ncbi:MAG: universal stress protein [Halovenus sp.]|uniref:universal stress protein n=1 Tax=Halovenus amylolytica TaxID=2500550 RepID=UPI000FE39ADB
MFETVVIATDGSESVKRGVTAAIDLAERFDGTVHALYVADSRTVEDSPSEIQSDVETAIQEAGEEALSYVEEQAGDEEIVTAIRDGTPAEEIIDYAESVDADAIAMGTRGRDGEHAFLLGSVAEAVVRHAPMPVLTVRQLEEN